jgi:hypothetical protein
MIQLKLPDGSFVDLTRAAARDLVDRLWAADDIRGAVPLAAAIATELESSLDFARPVSLDVTEAAALASVDR